jgi:hypothetical protein
MGDSKVGNSLSIKTVVKFLVPFLIAYLGSKAVFYYFSFNYSLFSDAFDIQKLFIDLGVFMVLFYLGTVLVKHVITQKDVGISG